MEIVQSDLVIIGANTTNAQVFFKGTQVPNIAAISVLADSNVGRVTLTIPEDPMLAELKAAGVIIKRV